MMGKTKKPQIAVASMKGDPKQICQTGWTRKLAAGH